MTPERSRQPVNALLTARLATRIREWRALRLVAEEGEDPHESLGPQPWTREQVDPWEVRHGHDVRIECAKGECDIRALAIEQVCAILPLLLDVAMIANRHPQPIELRDAMNRLANEQDGWELSAAHFDGTGWR